MRIALNLLLVAACVDHDPGGDADSLPRCTALCGDAAFCTADRSDCRCFPPDSSETVACDGTLEPDGGR